VFNAAGEQIPMHSNISGSEAVDLYRAVRAIKPECSLEVGFAHGVSAQAILQALEDNGTGTHHVVDPFQAEFGDCGLEMVKRAGLSHRMQFHRKFAEEVIPALPQIGFAFIDASHLFDLTVCEFVLTDKKLAVGGVVAFHDMWMPSQQAFIRYVLANRSYRPYQVAGYAESSVTGNSSIKQGIRNVCRKLPGSRRIFSEEFLRPWSEFRFGNLVCLEKTAQDQRDWRFHERF
jgi:predicted O-methyltransferase YrrM